MCYNLYLIRYNILLNIYCLYFIRKKYFSTDLFPFFENLLPEDWLLELTVSKLKIDKNNKFNLLLHVGGDTVGAVKIEPVKKAEK